MQGWIVMEGALYEGLWGGEEPYSVYFECSDATTKAASLESTAGRYSDILYTLIEVDVECPAAHGVEPLELEESEIQAEIADDQDR